MSEAEASPLPSTLLLRLASAFLAAAARLHAQKLLLNTHTTGAQHAADARRCTVSTAGLPKDDQTSLCRSRAAS